MYKICSTCKLEKNKIEFHVQRNKKDGLTAQCKKCRKISAKKSHDKMKNATKPILKTKACKICGVKLNISEFAKNSLRKDGYQSECRKCYSGVRYRPYKEKILERNKRWVEQNPEMVCDIKNRWIANNPKKRTRVLQKYYQTHKDQILQRNAIWAKNNPESARAKSLRYVARKKKATIYEFTYKQLKERISVFDNRCSYCGGPFDCIDHLKPLFLGGPHCLSNLRSSCKTCNSKKGHMPAQKWLKLICVI